MGRDVGSSHRGPVTPFMLKCWSLQEVLRAFFPVKTTTVWWSILKKKRFPKFRLKSDSCEDVVSPLEEVPSVISRSIRDISDSFYEIGRTMGTP